MRWRYYLIDRYDNKTQVDEPVGWDSFSLRIKRHAERHGTFRELQGNSFTFYNTGADLLRTEYKQYGIRGNYRLKIDGKCDGAWTEVYVGQMAFDSYIFTCENGCSVQIDLDQIGPLVQFINRFDQKVEVGSLTAFDGTTALTPYDNLTKNILLPSKAVLLRGIAKNTAAQEYVISNDSGWIFPSGTGQLQGGINLGFSTVDVNAIKTFSPQFNIDFYNYSQSKEYIPEIIYNEPEQDLNCTGSQFSVSFRAKGTFKNLNSGSGSMKLNLVLKKGSNTFNVGATQIQSWEVVGFFGGPVSTGVLNQPFDISYSGNITLAPGEKIWIDFFLTYTKTTSFIADVRLQLDEETNFSASVVSKCDPSTAQFYIINETASRITESITNGALKVYSEWLGRKDSQPYSFPDNGCGALKALALGLDVRKAKLSDGTDPKLFLSMADIFENLSAIDNIGIGNEGDDKIRIENWKWFYQSNVIAYHRNIAKLQQPAKPDEIWSVFKTGYDKWEAEDYNGLDEFLTKREYRTAIDQVQNPLEKICKWIASGYAFEVTRRKQNDTKDWRFDNDVFVLCMNNTTGCAVSTNLLTFYSVKEIPAWATVGTVMQITMTDNNGVAVPENSGNYTITSASLVSGFLQLGVSPSFATTLLIALVTFDHNFYQAETGIASGANLLDPATVYNARISPERNAFRWFDRIAQCYRNITNSDKLIFSAGDGNYLAETELNDPFGCKLESGVLSEKADISLAGFADAADGTPILNPERVKYTYPLSFEEYNEIAAAPYGLIYYQCGSESGYGWIDEIEYKPEDGQATFILIPKV